MAYVLDALIGDLALLRGKGELVVVPLPQGKGLVPLVRERWDEHAPQPLLRASEARDAPESELESPEERRRCLDEAAASFAWITALCERLSAAPGAALAYVEAEFWAGEGGQAAAVWEEGRLVLGPAVEAEAINHALARLGVEAGAERDAFDALGLGRCRMTDDWVRLAG